MDCTGDFEGNNGAVCHALARLVFDDIGNCTDIFAGLAIGSDEKNLRDLSVTYNAEENRMDLHGSFFGYELTDESYVKYQDGYTGLMYLYAVAEKDTDSALRVMVCLRHPGGAWDYENDPIALDEQYVSLYAGMPFEELVESFGLDVSRLPSKAQGGSTNVPTGPSKSYDTSGFDGRATLYGEDLIAVDYPTAEFSDDGSGIGCDAPYIYIYADTILAPNSSSVSSCEEDMALYARDNDYSAVTDENIMLGAHGARRVIAESSWLGNTAIYLIDLGDDGSDNAGWAYVKVKYDNVDDLEKAEAILSTIRAE